MTDSVELHSSILGEVRRIFADSELARTLRPGEISVVDGKIVVLYDGFPHDSRGPFGAQFQLPKAEGDEIWDSYSNEYGGVHDWAAYGVVFRILEIYETSFEKVRPEGLKGTWWIEEDV